MKLNLEEIWQSLAGCRMDIAINLLQPWVEEALPGEVDLLFDASPPGLRRHLALLLEDLLGGWPQGVLGVPVMVWFAYSADRDQGTRRVVLPGAGAQCSQPAEGLRFLGWLNKSALLPAMVRAGSLAEVEVGVGDAAVALFNVELGVNVDKVVGMEVPPIWWGELLHEVAGSVYVSVGVMQSYPVALEVARAMVRAADGAMGGERVAELFATRLELAAGAEAGKLFKSRAEAALQGCGSWRAAAGDDGPI